MKEILRLNEESVALLVLRLMDAVAFTVRDQDCGG